MEYRSIFERINNANNIEEISKVICKNYNIGDYIKHKIIEIGYEDFNVVLDSTKGKYFVKILNKDRTDEECLRLANIYNVARNNGINVPKIYKCNEEFILNLHFGKIHLRILLMEYINGTNMYELDRNLTLEEIKEVAQQAAKINKIDFNLNSPCYDEWTLINFKSEYEKRHDFICEEDKEMVDNAYKKFLKLDFERLPKSYIHGDIMNANLIKDKEKIWLIDFSAVNYLPRIIELVVIAYGICIFDDREESINRLNYFLNKYNEKNEITEEELEVFCVVLNIMGAMSLMQSSFIKAKGEIFKENQYWLDKGKEVINLNLKKEEIKVLKKEV